MSHYHYWTFRSFAQALNYFAKVFTLFHMCQVITLNFYVYLFRILWDGANLNLNLKTSCIRKGATEEKRKQVILNRS